tara:strand:+ start:4683 stop:6185 length:1503 start_codon:yes stop_codon:yes gene_type:complete
MAKSINRLMAELVTPTGNVDNSALTNLDLIDSADVISIANNTSAATAVFDTLDSLPTTGLSAGQQAFVNGNNRLYISNGTGWYNLTFVNRTPTWYTEPDVSYDITDSVTPLLVTAKAIDSDNSNINLLNQSIATDSAQYMVNISNDSSVFTFTPKSADSIGIEVAAGNLTDSNGDFSYTFKWSDGINFVSKSVTIGYSPAAPSVAISDYTGDRALVGGRTTSSDGSGGQHYSQIQYFGISSTGNSGTFGDLNNAGIRCDTVSDSTTAVFLGTNSTTIEYKTFATTGNASLWSGVMPSSYMGVNGGQFSDGIWGITYKASNSSEYITFASQGDAQSFGDTPINGYNAQPGANDPTRGLRIAGGGYNTDAIEYITLQTLNSAADFGSTMITQGWYRGAAVADETRVVAAGGFGNSVVFSRMEYLTVQVPSNSTSFGNLTQARGGLQGTSNGTRGVFIGGSTTGGYPVNYTNKMDYITIATTSSAYNFGSASTGQTGGAASGT